jgi:hypothetical protein
VAHAGSIVSTPLTPKVWLDESAIEDFASIQRGIDAKNNPALTLQRPPRILFSV